MPEETSFRQMDEKHVSVEVELMLWSPKFDLVALSNVQGEVVLHRLSWQKVWSVPPPSEDVKVKALAWRPDGKVLAAGYSSGKINLYHIENAEILHTLELQGEITSMVWICQAVPEGVTWSPEPYQEDNFSTYLPKLQPLSKSYGTLTKGPPVEENVEDSKKLGDQKELNLLIAGCGSCDLHMFGYGVYPIAAMSLPHQQDMQVKRILSAVMSQDLQSLSVVVELGSENLDTQKYFLLTYDTALISSRHKELRLLSLKCGQVSTLIGYLQLTVQQMSEAWEDILMEMDSKLLKFAEEKKLAGTGTVSNDFLELLMFGTPSPELQTFLLNDLTDKGLKKLGHSIETSYSNIQKLVVKHLQVVSQAILYQLTELKGMSMWYEKFGVLGLNTQSIQEAVTAVGSFVLKTSELQQVIDDSIKNFKAFFRWLYVVIQRMSNEKPPADLTKMTQHDINFVAEFLRDNFAHFTVDEGEDSIADLMADQDRKPGFKLEKVGQYLKKEDLHYPPNISANPWVQFQRGSFQLKDTHILYPSQNNKSLVQLQEDLESYITSALSRPSTVIGQSLECQSLFHLCCAQKQSHEKSIDSKESEKKVTLPRTFQFTANEQQRLYTVFMPDVLPCEKCYILRRSSSASCSRTEAVVITVGSLGDTSINSSTSSDTQRCKSHKILDVAFYDEKTLSLLLVEDEEDQKPVLAQLTLSAISDDDYVPMTPSGILNSSELNVTDISEKMEPHCYRRLENMKAHSFAVSGTRKTATVLFSSRRRVRIFLMDAEDDEEDEEVEDETEENEEDKSGEINTNSTQETDMHVDENPVQDDQEDKENTSLG